MESQAEPNSIPHPPSPIPRWNIALIGMMGSGKTTVGRLLAERLGWDFLDTDAMVVEAAGKSVAEIFEEDGEPAFRELEAAAIQEAVMGEGRVIATGGGAVLRPENLERLKARCWVVWLSATPEEHARRVANGERRPLLERYGDPVAAARRILIVREPLYSQAHWKEDTTSRTLKDVVNTLQTQWSSANADVNSHGQR